MQRSFRLLRRERARWVLSASLTALTDAGFVSAQPAEPPAAPPEPPAEAPPSDAAPDAPPAEAAPPPVVPEAEAEVGPEAAPAVVPEAEAEVSPEAAPPEESEPTEARSLSDVVVTAQKRVEKVQEVPTSITVASGKRLTQENVSTANDVERLTPNLSGQQSSGRQSRARWFLRGIGTNDPSLNLESPLGIHQDEVFVA